MVENNITIVKTVAVTVGGGRTTDEIIWALNGLQKKRGRSIYFYIDRAINQKSMPSGYGKEQVVALEFFRFDHDPTYDEIKFRCRETGYSHPTYEDGLIFQEDYPDDQRQIAHVFVPEIPWRSFDRSPQALLLWGNIHNLSVCLMDVNPFGKFNKDCIFARRKRA